MPIRLRVLFRRGLCLLSLLVLGQSLFLNIAAGQQKSGISKSKPKPDSTRTTVVTKIELIPRTVSGNLLEDREVTISLYPCKGEEPGNVLRISEQSQVSDRVAAFRKKLREPDQKTRSCAARQLGYIGRDANDAVPDLIRLTIDEENRGVRNNVIDALWAIGPEPKFKVKELLELINSPDVYVRLYASFALGYHKPIANEKLITRALISATRDQNATVGWMAVKGLGRLGPIAKDAVSVLIQILQTKDNPLRAQATEALSNIGPDAAAAVPVLFDQLYAGDYNLYLLAVNALASIGPAILPLLEAELKTHPFHILAVLDRLGPSGAPLVIEAMRMQNNEARKVAIETIGWSGSAGEPAVPLLVDALKDRDENIRYAAANALQHLARVARTATPALTAALNDRASLIQCSAARALGAIGPPAKSAVPRLLGMMKLPIRDGEDMPQICAAEGLMNMSPETKVLVPAHMIKRVERRNETLTLSHLFAPDETRPRVKQKPKKKPAQVF